MRRGAGALACFPVSPSTLDLCPLHLSSPPHILPDLLALRRLSLLFPFISPWVPGEAVLTESAHFSAPAPPAPLSLLLFLSPLSHILGTVWCPQTPIWLCLYPESQLFLSHYPHPQLGTHLFSLLFQFLTLLPSFLSQPSSVFILNSTVPFCPS